MCSPILRGSLESLGKPRASTPPSAASMVGPALGAAMLAMAITAPSVALAQQADGQCSGFACLFGHASPPPAQPQPPSPVAAGPLAAGPVEGSAATPAPDKVTRTPRPARPVVTIAAGATEVARLKGLAAALPRERIRIIPVTDAGARVEADFTVSKALGVADKSGKTKLFTEQLHVVAGDKVHTMADLAGKVVGFAGGGAREDAARQAIATLNIKVKDTPLDLANALDGLSTGDLDAVVILAPQPVVELAVVKAPGLHLISWPEGGSLPNGAVVTSIEGDRYPQLARPGESIRALGVDAVLTMSAKGAKIAAAHAFLASLSRHAGALSRHGFDLVKADGGGRDVNRLASAERR